MNAKAEFHTARLSCFHASKLLAWAERGSSNLTQKLCLENEFALLVLLAGLESFVVLPSYRLLALFAVYISHDVAACRHVAFSWVTLGDVNDAVEKVCFAVLASEVPTDDIIMIGEVGFAILAAIDLVGVQVDVVCQPHREGRPKDFNKEPTPLAHRCSRGARLSCRSGVKLFWSAGAPYSLVTTAPLIRSLRGGG